MSVRAAQAVLVGVAAGVMALAGCTVTVAEDRPSDTSASPMAPTENADTTATPAAKKGDLADPCTLLPAELINAELGTELPDGTTSYDSARKITTCRYASDDMTQIVGVTVSDIDGKKSFDLNRKLAQAYFGGEAQTIQLQGAEQAYLVIADTFRAPVVGMLVRGHFALVQVGVQGTTPEQGQALAAQAAARMP